MKAQPDSGPPRGTSLPAIAAGGLVWLASFAILYTIGDAVGAWPKLPPGAFRDLDLWVGIGAGFALLVVLARRKTAPRP